MRLLSPLPHGSRPSSRASIARRGIGTTLVVLVLALVASLPAAAALIATGDGTGNTTAPSPDPGFARVGVVNGLSAVYARNGWVLTASHVGEGSFLLGGTSYAAVPGSSVRFTNPDATRADLIAFKLATRPSLADVAISSSAPGLNALVTVVGYGRNRGAATAWMGMSGFEWAASRTMRWGTNRISGVGETVLDTRAFRITFDPIQNPPSGQHEADIVNGDSGGGAFIGSGSSAELAGILFAHATFVGQPEETSLYGNDGLIVDLSAYRAAILAITDRPDCNDGLDEDGDGLVDHPADPGCDGPSDTSERSSALVCDNGVDDDRDGLIDYPADPGCAIGTDVSERGAWQECDNGIDDDDDAAVDFPNDSGCLHPTNPVELPEPGAGLLLCSGALALALASRASRTAAQASSTRSTR